MLVVHHLEKSQSERIVWLCEELEIPFELKRYARDPVTRRAPPEYKALHVIGAAPVVTDGGLVLAESGAIVEYVVSTYGNGRLIPRQGHPEFIPYLYWFHFANGTLQPALARASVLRRVVAEDHPALVSAQERLRGALSLLDTRLGHSHYLAGPRLSAADIMAVFSLTTMRFFSPLDLRPYPQLLAYLRRIGERDAYRRAMRKGDPNMLPLLD